MSTRPRVPSLGTRLATERLVLRPALPSDVPELRRVLRKNAAHLRPWTPKSHASQDPTSLTNLSKTVLHDRRDWRKGNAFALLVTARDSEALVLGRLTLSNVVRGPFRGAHLGYWIDADHQGQGLMTEAVRAALDFAFRELELHRVQINVIPRNVASRRILEKLGLRTEGTAERLLEIAGVWEDHLMFAVTAEEWTPR